MGSEKDGVRCENLEKLTFANETFDLVITQDVMEHVHTPQAAFNSNLPTINRDCKGMDGNTQAKKTPLCV